MHEKLRKFIEEGLNLYTTKRIKEITFVKGLQNLYNLMPNEGDKFFVESLYTTTLPKNILRQLKGFDKKEESYNYTYNEKFQHYIPQNYKTFNPQYGIVLPGIDDLEQGKEDKMSLGVEYIKPTNFGRKYAHMRRMLQECWNIEYTPPHGKFDIDPMFKFNETAIAQYIEDKFNSDTINEAHRRAIANYKRGKPAGSRNRNTVFVKASTTYPTSDTFNDLPAIDEIIEGTAVEEVNTNSTNTGQMLDTAKFVTWQQFSDRVSPIERNVEAICKDLIDIQAWGHVIDAEIEALKQAKPTIIEIKPAPELPTFSMGIQHKSFEDLWAMVNSRLPSGFPVIPWVYGPAGTGKSYACESIAKAMAKVLGREFNCYAVGTTLAKFETLGFVNTSGYQSTPFRLAYEYGHLFCADEMDSWAKEATVALNNALANGECAFPDKIVKRHPNFIMVACANTVGAGATMDYAGRNKQDAATLDRFQYLHWELDEALEDNLTANKDWLKYVRHVRARANASGINPKPMITPRASMAGTALLAGGLAWNKVVNMCLRKGLSEPQWNQIK